MSTMVIFLLVRGQVSRGRANIVSWRPTSQKPIYDYGYYSGTLVEYRILVVELTDQRCRSSVCVCVCVTETEQGAYRFATVWAIPC